MFSSSEEPTVQFSLFLDIEPRKPWSTVLGENVSSAVAAMNRAERRRAKIRRRSEIMAGGDGLLETAPDPAVPLPETRAHCSEQPRVDESGEWIGGVCPVLRCRWNLLLEIRRKGDSETIIVGARGGRGVGASMPLRRNYSGATSIEALDRIVDEIVDRADSMPSTCMWDYVENPDLIEAKRDGALVNEYQWTPHMTLEQIATVFGMTREGARRTEVVAIQKLQRRESGGELDPTFVPLSRLTND